MRRAFTQACLGLITALGLASTAQAQSPHLGSHAILYPETPYSAKQKMFEEASQAGAGMIRVDISLASIYIQGEYQGRTIEVKNWSRSDQFAQLSRHYKLPLLVVLYGTPAHTASCGADNKLLCPPGEIGQYQQMIKEIVSRYKTVSQHWEILNEPDKTEYFQGSPQEYAEMLKAAHTAIHQADPQGKLVLGGISDIESSAWMDRVMAAGAAPYIDIPSIHLRSSATGAARRSREWRDYFDRQGIQGPMFLTEYGYPADPAKQWDPNYKQGEESQAQFYKTTLPWLLSSGAGRIFVTLRDWGGGSFASEGLLSAPDPLPESPQVRRRAAYSIFQEYAARLEAKNPPAAKGSITVAANQPSRIRSRNGKIKISFACPQDGDCPAQSFRLKLKSGGAYMLRNPEGIKARSTRTISLKLTRLTRKKLARNPQGIAAEILTLKAVSLKKVRLLAKRS